MYVQSIGSFEAPLTEVAEKSAQWITIFTKEALDLQVKNRMQACGKSIGEEVSIQHITIPDDSSYQVVAWDQGIISEVGQDLPLYTRHIGPCIAILARAFQENSEQVTHTALHHLFMLPERFGDTLKALCEKVQKGRVEIFVTGGLMQMATSRANRFKVIVLIEKFISEYPAIQFVHCQNLFGLCDIGKPYKQTTTMLCPESVGLEYVGFDPQHNPCQIVGVTHDHNVQEPFDVIWSYS